MTDRLIDGKELAEKLSVSTRSVARMVEAGMPWIPLLNSRGYSKRRYDWGDVLEWLKSGGDSGR